MISSALGFCSCLIGLQTWCQDNNLNHIFTDWILRAIHSKTSEADRGAAAANFRARSKVISNGAASRSVEWTPSSLCCQHVFVEIKTAHQIVLLPSHWTVDFTISSKQRWNVNPATTSLMGPALIGRCNTWYVCRVVALLFVFNIEIWWRRNSFLHNSRAKNEHWVLWQLPRVLTALYDALYLVSTQLLKDSKGKSTSQCVNFQLVDTHLSCVYLHENYMEEIPTVFIVTCPCWPFPNHLRKSSIALLLFNFTKGGVCITSPDGARG